MKRTFEITESRNSCDRNAQYEINIGRRETKIERLLKCSITVKVEIFKFRNVRPRNIAIGYIVVQRNRTTPSENDNRQG